MIRSIFALFLLHSRRPSNFSDRATLSDMFTIPLLLFWAILITSCVPGYQNNVTSAVDAVSTDVFISRVPIDKFLISTLILEEGLEDCPEEDYDDTQICVKMYMNQSGSGCMDGAVSVKKFDHDTITMSHIYGNVTLPQGVHPFLVKNVSCLVYNINKLNCTWVIPGLPTGAQHSVSVTVRLDDQSTTCDYFTNSEASIVGCHANIDEDVEYMIVHINVSLPNFCYIHSKTFEKAKINKLNPPTNVSASVMPDRSGEDRLIIKWDFQSKLPAMCFRYQININNEILNSTTDKELAIPNINLYQKYLIKVRVTKTSSCRMNNIWSDWSEPVEVMVAKGVTVLNGFKIVAISLGIPMFLLTVLLLCRWHRIADKLFPPIPRPSVKIKQLLETEEIVQVMQSESTKEVTEIEHDM